MLTGGIDETSITHSGLRESLGHNSTDDCSCRLSLFDDAILKVRRTFIHNKIEELMRRQGQCPRCGEHCNLTRHHIYPKRWYRKHRNQWRAMWNAHTVLLCRECHDDIEHIIESEERSRSHHGLRVPLCLTMYDIIVTQFIGST